MVNDRLDDSMKKTPKDEYAVVDTAKNGSKAVEKSTQEKPDVVTMDIMMPKTNGIEATKEIKNENGFEIHIVATSSTDQEELINSTFDAGADGFIQKPIDVDYCEEINSIIK